MKLLLLLIDLTYSDISQVFLFFHTEKKKAIAKNTKHEMLIYEQ